MGRLTPSPVWKAAVSVQTAPADREDHALHMQSMKRYRFMKSPASSEKVRSGAAEKMACCGAQNFVAASKPPKF